MEMNNRMGKGVYGKDIPCGFKKKAKTLNDHLYLLLSPPLALTAAATTSFMKLALNQANA